MSWIKPASRRPRRVPKAGRPVLWIAAICGIALLSTACNPTVPPVEQPPPRGLPSGVPPAATQAEPVLPTPARLAVP